MLKAISRRSRTFGRAITLVYGRRQTELVAIIRNRSRYQVIYRLAALRCLVATAPLNVTQGAPYIQRRRAVRQHYQV